MNWRPWPRSLAGQLVLILFGGVLLSLISSAAIHLYDRNQAVSYMGSLQTAERFADIVQTLDPLTLEEQKRIAGILETPHQFVRIFDQQPSQHTNIVKNVEKAHHLEKIMRRFLGNERPVSVEILMERPMTNRPGFRHMKPATYLPYPKQRWLPKLGLFVTPDLAHPHQTD